MGGSRDHEMRRYQTSLPADHGWKARPGYNVFVADRGAVRFDYPRDWVVEPGENGAIRFLNKPEPDDDCTLQVSVLRAPLPMGEGPPPVELLRQTAGSDPREVSRSQPRRGRNEATEYAWARTRFVDETTDRDAFSYSCIARGGAPFAVHVLLTMSLWVEDASWVRPIWDEVLRSLRVGVSYDLSGEDPRRN